MTLGKKIKELRKADKMLQRELAYKLNVGDAYVSKVENDIKSLKEEHLKTLSKIFKVPLKELKTLWLADKVYSLVRDEDGAIDILRVAEREIKYRTNKSQH